MNRTKAILPARQEYLLEAPLELLHQESLDWLREIDFWKDEAAFFYSLMWKRSAANAFLRTTQAKKIQQHLVYLTAERLDDLKLETRGHEKMLARLLDKSNADQRAYREKHKALAVRMHAMEKEFRLLKKKIFTLAKSKPRSILS